MLNFLGVIMNNSLEIKIYELLGIKKFKKMVLSLIDIIHCPFILFMNEEKKKKYTNNYYDNYRMKKGHGLQDLRDFKKNYYLMH